MTSKKIKILILVPIVLIILALSTLYYVFFIPNTNSDSGKNTYIYIGKERNYDDFLSEIVSANVLKSYFTFKISSNVFGRKILKSGRYKIDNGMSNYQLIRRFRNGQQEPMKLIIRSVRTKGELANMLSKQLMLDSTSIAFRLNDSLFLAKLNREPISAIALFLPNTYEVYWTISPDNLFARMERESKLFWNKDREEKAEELGLTKAEIYTLASIVDSETNSIKEKPIVAGLYLNRLKRGIPLQADPTVIFAVGDFTINRVLYEHLKVKSPYNTYLNKGLPPGPIRIPTIAGIDAVLNYDKNDYIYMCAKETLNGEHNFARNLSEHSINARKYQAVIRAYRQRTKGVK